MITWALPRRGHGRPRYRVTSNINRLFSRTNCFWLTWNASLNHARNDHVFDCFTIQQLACWASGNCCLSAGLFLQLAVGFTNKHFVNHAVCISILSPHRSDIMNWSTLNKLLVINCLLQVGSIRPLSSFGGCAPSYCRQRSNPVYWPIYCAMPVVRQRLLLLIALR